MSALDPQEVYLSHVQKCLTCGPMDASCSEGVSLFGALAAPAQPSPRMHPAFFCYWLRGLLEGGNPQTLDARQVALVRRHLDLVFRDVAGDQPAATTAPVTAGSPKFDLVDALQKLQRVDCLGFSGLGLTGTLLC